MYSHISWCIDYTPHSCIKYHHKVYCSIFLAVLWCFQNLHFIGLFFLKWLLSLCFLSPILKACRKFSLLVHHSRFSRRLSLFIQFIWFTSGLFSGLGINAWATSLCVTTFCCFQFLQNLNIWYHFSVVSLSILHLNQLLFTLPKLLTWYNHSYQSISFHTSFSINNK